MRTDKKGQVVRVSARLEDIRKSYGFMSRFYGVLEEKFEKGVRRKGLDLLAVEEGETVLEIGTGTGCSLREIASSVGKAGKAYGVDITFQMLELSKQRIKKAKLPNRVELFEADAKELPFQDHKFDAVYMACTLEAFDTPDIPKVLQESKRVLKPKGRLGVASLSREGREGSKFIGFYEWFHRRFPKYASCRPIYVEKAIEDAGFKTLAKEKLVLAGLAPFEIVAARKPNAEILLRRE